MTTDPPSPPPPPPPLPPGARRGVRGRFRDIAAAAAVLAFLVGATALNAWIVFGQGDDDEGYVYTRYNDALVDGDWAAAWGLGCRRDRDRVDLDTFEERVEAAIEPLGGLDSWGRLRGGAEWQGPLGSEKRRPEVDDSDGRACVRLDGHPLGVPF